MKEIEVFKKNNSNTASYHEELILALQDPEEALAYLNEALEEYESDGDYEAFMLALKHLAEAKGGINRLAESTHLNRQNLYRVLSKNGNPRLDTLSAVIHGLGFKLAIARLDEAA